MEAAEQIRELTKLLEEANYQYYVLDDPKMEDYEYDRLMRQLEELEARHPELASPLSPTKRVGGQAISQFEKVEHPVPGAGVSGWEVHSGRHPGGRTGRGGRHRKPEDHSFHSHGAGGRAQAAHCTG